MKILLSLFLSLTCILFHAQNLVPNWSFEEYTTCPDHVDNIGDCVGWTNFAGSCDYFNGCAGQGGLSTPDNVHGYQSPLEGQAYIGLVARQLSNAEYREYAGIALIENLVIGHKYFFSMYVSRADDTGNGAVRDFGMSLTTHAYGNSNSLQATNTSLIGSSYFLTNSELWTYLHGSFIADSAYSHIVIGNFYSDNETEFYTISDPGTAAYYYVDGVRLSTDSIFALTPLSTLDKHDFGRSSVYPNPFKETLSIVSNAEIIQLRIIDLVGQEYFSYQFANHTWAFSYDFSALVPQTYVLEIIHRDRRIERFKILK